jgi:hypothetical protein
MENVQNCGYPSKLRFKEAKEGPMGKGQTSIGDDTPSGEPENGPRGPYITDESEDISKPSPKKDNDRDWRKTPDADWPARTETEITKESELGTDDEGVETRRKKTKLPPVL